MTKFNYKKWIVENKFGKPPSYSNYSALNEQTGSIDTGSISEETQTWYQNDGCSPCEGGYVVSGSGTEQLIVSVSSLGNICTPTIEGTAVEVPTSIITSENP